MGWCGPPGPPKSGGPGYRGHFGVTPSHWAAVSFCWPRYASQFEAMLLLLEQAARHSLLQGQEETDCKYCRAPSCPFVLSDQESMI